MRLTKGIAWMTASVICALGVTYLIEAWRNGPDTGEFDRTAIKQIKRLCGHRTDCQVRMRDLTTTDWDTFYEMNGAYSKEEVSLIIGAPYRPARESGRLILLMKQGHVVFQGLAEEGVESSLANEVFFQCRTHTETLDLCKPDALLKVHPFMTKGDPARVIARSGTSYTLSQVN